MAKIFFTGFPGFLGTALLPRILRRRREAKAVCLVQEKFIGLARQRAAGLVADDKSLFDRIEIIAGDITSADLGLEDAVALEKEVVEIFHLAAIYDLSVQRDFAMKVNVDGTSHMLDFAERCTRLERFQYVSTCYVSGCFAGEFGEDDLVKGQSFNNYYEETKYLAEVEVQKRRGAGLPTTIYRPGIVVGSSQTGETPKFDGPYFVIRWILRQPGPLVTMPVVGDSNAVRVNLVPADFVVDAIDYLASLDSSVGQVYQLADPQALTVHELIDAISQATSKRILRIPLPLGVAKAAIDYVPGVYRIMQIPSTAVDYFVQPTRYSSMNTQRDLAPTSIACPKFDSYLLRLVDFVKEHPEVGSKAMS